MPESPVRSAAGILFLDRNLVDRYQCTGLEALANFYAPFTRRSLP